MKSNKHYEPKSRKKRGSLVKTSSKKESLGGAWKYAVIQRFNYLVAVNSML